MHTHKKRTQATLLHCAWTALLLLASSLATHSAQAQEAPEGLNALQHWLGVPPAAQAHLAFGDCGRGRGLVAAKAFAPGDVIMHIPLRHILTVSKAKQHPKAQLVKAVWDQVHPNSLISWALSWGVARFWAPYLALVPSQENCALLFTQAEREKYVQPLSFYQGYEAWRASVISDYQRLCAALPEKERKNLPTQATFLGNRALAASRVFGIDQPEKSEPGLVPYADLLNHEARPNCTWGYDEAAGAFLVTCTRPIEAGEEVLDTYGKKENESMWRFYGFTLPYRLL